MEVLVMKAATEKETKFFEGITHSRNFCVQDQNGNTLPIEVRVFDPKQKITLKRRLKYFKLRIEALRHRHHLRKAFPNTKFSIVAGPDHCLRGGIRGQ
jgi:hypothetical protein